MDTSHCLLVTPEEARRRHPRARTNSAPRLGRVFVRSIWVSNRDGLLVVIRLSLVDPICCSGGGVGCDNISDSPAATCLIICVCGFCSENSHALPAPSTLARDVWCTWWSQQEDGKRLAVIFLEL